MAKFTGPYTVTNGDYQAAYVVGTLDGEPQWMWIMCRATKLNSRRIGEQLHHMRKIAAAMNAAEGIKLKRVRAAQKRRS